MFYILLISLSIILISTKYLLLNEETFILVSFILFYIYANKVITPQIKSTFKYEIRIIKDRLTESSLTLKQFIFSLKQKLENISSQDFYMQLKVLLIKSINETLHYILYKKIYKDKLSYINKFSVLLNIEKDINKLIFLYFYMEIKSLIENKLFFICKVKNVFLKKKSLIENQELIIKI